MVEPTINSEEPNQEKRYWQCEAGLHKEEIPAGSFLDTVWEMQQQKGITGNLIIDQVSCPYCSPVTPR